MQKKLEFPAKLSDISYQSGFIGMVLVVLMTFIVGANGLNTDVIWFDELTSVGHMGVFADFPFTPQQVVASLAEESAQHMPLYFLIGSGWAQVAGWSQLALRMLSLYAGVLMVAWLYRFGTDVFNRRVGLIAAFLIGSSAFMIVYLHEIRMYAMLMLLAVIHTWLYWRLAHRTVTGRLLWVSFVLTTACLFYTHIFSTVLFAGLGIYHLLFVKKSRRWLLIIGGWGIGAILFLPYVPVVLIGFTQATNKVSTFTTALSTPDLISTFIYLVTNGLPFLLIIAAICLIYAQWHTRNRNIFHWLIITGVMFITLVLINERFGLVPLRRSRYLLLLWFPMLILIAYGLTSIPYWKIVVVIWAVIWGFSGWQLYRLPDFLDHIGTIEAVYAYPPMQHYVSRLQNKVRPQDYMIGFTDANFVNNTGKHDKNTADYYLEAQLGIDGAFIPSNLTDENLENDAPLKIDHHPYLLFTYNPLDKPKVFENTLDILERDYMACDVVLNDRDLFVQRYVLQSLSCDREYEPIVYANGIIIVDMFAEYDSASDRVKIVTGWEISDEQQLFDYNVSIQLVTGDWQNVGQTDRHLHDDLLKWYVAELSTDELPPNDYRVMVVLYEKETGEKVTGTVISSGETGTILPITVITIEE